MSRCFPYLPTGYSMAKYRNEVLIESIKLHPETERVAKNRRKEEKRKEKKEKRKEKDKAKACTEKIWTEPNSGCFLKGREAVTEQLEKSSVTEEHEQPIYLCIPSSPSDSTGNSNKRKRHSSPVDGSHSRGNIIRFRLQLPKKLKEHDSTGRTDFPAEHNNEIASRANQGKIAQPLRKAATLWQACPPELKRSRFIRLLGEMRLLLMAKLELNWVAMRL